jgi:hypothetical protein
VGEVDNMNEKAIKLLDSVKPKISMLELRNEKFVIELTNDNVSISRKKKSWW